MRGTEAVGARIAAADDDDVTAVHVDRGVLDVAELHPVGGRQVFHRLMDAIQFTTFCWQIACFTGTTGQDQCIEVCTDVINRNIVADLGIGFEGHAFSFHLFQSSL